MTAHPDARRAVFLDVDGTIMQDGHYIPPSAAAAIRAARARGHLVFLSTGRGMAEIQGELWDIGFDGAVSNGGAFATLGDEVVAATSSRRTRSPDSSGTSRGRTSTGTSSRSISSSRAMACLP